MEEKQEKLYYKLLRQEHFTLELVSAVMSQEYHRFHVTYREKHCGPLAVFETLQDAHRFMKNNRIIFPWKYTYVIFSCEIAVSKFHGLWKNNKRGIVSAGLPKGTVFADSVKLVERVYPEKKSGEWNGA